MTVFADLHYGNRVELLDEEGFPLPVVWLLLETARPCENGCCVAFAVRLGESRPHKLHARCDAEVALVPHPRPSECGAAASSHSAADQGLARAWRDPTNPAEAAITAADEQDYREEQTT